MLSGFLTVRGLSIATAWHLQHSGHRLVETVRSPMPRVTFDIVPMASGGFKDCHRARVIEGPYAGFPTGTTCVIKGISAKAYEQGIRIKDIDISMQNTAQNLVQQFNSGPGQGIDRKAYMRTAQLAYMNGKKRGGWDDGEAFIIEKLIPGEFEKFNSNTGWSSGKYNLPDALSHWSWVHTKGQMLLCDLQGHRGRPFGPTYHGSTKYYSFTDPAILSPHAGQFGCTDLGADGIRAWFKRHKCNQLCRSLGLEGKVPQSSHSNVARQRGTAWRLR